MEEPGTLSEIRDINEQLLLAGLREQELADRLARQLAFTSAIARSLGEGVCALDGEGRITFVNPAVSRLLGWSEAELLGRELHELVHVGCGAACDLLHAIRSRQVYSNDDDVFMRQDGTLLPTAYSTAPITAAEAISGVVVAFQDMTERKRRLHLEQLARANAEAALRLRSDALHIIAHDLRTPLTSIKGAAQLLARQITATRTANIDQVLGALRRIDAAATRMMAVLAELLDVAQLQEGRSLTLQTSPVDLVALTRMVTDEQQALTLHVLTVDTTERSLVGEWDGPRLERVLGNLLTNAIKYSATDGPITIRLWSDTVADAGRWAVLEVCDEGVGIPAADLSHVFERFHRGHNVAGKFSGTGLGLAGAKATIEQHGGTISIESTEAVGTTVTVRLPLD